LLASNDTKLQIANTREGRVSENDLPSLPPNGSDSWKSLSFPILRFSSKGSFGAPDRAPSPLPTFIPS